MSTVALLDEARERAIAILRRCATPHGFRASALAAGYPQIWARDSMVVFLGAAAVGDPDLLAAGRASLETMGRYQSPRGMIQLNVNPDSGYISTENAGAVDANLWFLLGHYLHLQSTGDVEFLRRHSPFDRMEGDALRFLVPDRAVVENCGGVIAVGLAHGAELHTRAQAGLACHRPPYCLFGVRA